MQHPTQCAPREFVASLQAEVETYLSAVMHTVNQAPDGAWIADSEEEVRDLSAEFRTRVFQSAVQARVDAAEAAFPPSAGKH